VGFPPSEWRWKMAPDLMGSRRGVRATTGGPPFERSPVYVGVAIAQVDVAASGTTPAGSFAGGRLGVLRPGDQRLRGE
jgi:hypothetical protein